MPVVHPKTKESQGHFSAVWTSNIHVELSRVDYEVLSGDRLVCRGEPPSAHAFKLCAILRKSFSNHDAETICTAYTCVREIWQFCRLQDEGQNLVRVAMSQLNLSARAYHRTQSVKLAHTIADLAGSEEMQSAHLAEALQYRSKLMMS